MTKFIFDVRMTCEVEADTEEEASMNMSGDGFDPYATDIDVALREEA